MATQKPKRKKTETTSKPLSAAERADAEKELPHLQVKVESILAEKRETDGDYTEKLRPLKKRISSLANALVSGELVETYEIREEHDDKAMMVKVIDGTTGKVKRTRPMTETELAARTKRLQVDLPFDGKAPPAKATTPSKAAGKGATTKAPKAKTKGHRAKPTKTKAKARK